jgi:hypothetical protein
VSNFFFVGPRFVALCDKAIDCHLRVFHERRHSASSTYERRFVTGGWRIAPMALLRGTVSRRSFALKHSLQSRRTTAQISSLREL